MPNSSLEEPMLMPVVSEENLDTTVSKSLQRGN